MPLFLNHFSLYEKTRRILETYQAQPFPHYHKLSTIMDNSRATGRFTHRGCAAAGTTHFSDIDSESDHSASMDLSNQAPQANSQRLLSESLASSHPDRSTSSTAFSTLSLATPHSELSRLPTLSKPSSSVYSTSPVTFSQGYPSPFTTPQVYTPPSSQQDPQFFQQGGPIRRSVSNPTTSAPSFGFNSTMPSTASTSFAPLSTSKRQQDSVIPQSVSGQPSTSNLLEQSAPVHRPVSNSLTSASTSSIGSSLKRKR